MARAAKKTTTKAGKLRTAAVKAGDAADMLPASRILSAPKGPRTLTHRQIAQAVRRVIMERLRADA